MGVFSRGVSKSDNMCIIIHGSCHNFEVACFISFILGRAIHTWCGFAWLYSLYTGAHGKNHERYIDLDWVTVREWVANFINVT